MTVALGLACSNGALLATDSMGMQGRLANSVTKIHAFNTAPILWTFSGSTFVAQELQERIGDVEEKWLTSDLADPHDLDPVVVKKLIERDIRPLVADAYSAVLTPPGSQPVSHGIDLMFAFWSARGGGFLIRFYADLAIMLNTEPVLTRGYAHEYATVAHGLMGHHLGDGSTLHEGQLLAHRTISAVCETSSGGVGLPVQLGLVDSSGAKVLDVDQVEAVSVAVDRWKTLERETLLGYLAGDVVPTAVRKDLPELDH